MFLNLIGGGGHMNLHSGGSHTSDYIGDGHIDRWRSAEVGGYQSPGNADSTCGVFGHGQLDMLLLKEMVDMRIFLVFLITLVVVER